MMQEIGTLFLNTHIVIPFYLLSGMFLWVLHKRPISAHQESMDKGADKLLIFD